MTLNSPGTTPYLYPTKPVPSQFLAAMSELRNLFLKRSGLVDNNGTISVQYTHLNGPLRTILTWDDSEFYPPEFIPARDSFDYSEVNGEPITKEQAEYIINKLLEIGEFSYQSQHTVKREDGTSYYVSMNGILHYPKVASNIPSIFEKIRDTIQVYYSIDYNAQHSGCRTGCTGLCQGGCGTTASGGCGNDCSGACYITCSTYCTDSCVSNCGSDCSTVCITSCGSTCSMTCTTKCVNTCTGACASGCTATCDINCDDGCVNTCDNVCISTCTNNCTDGCLSACTTECTGCDGSCGSTCGNACETGCDLTCTTSCNDQCTTGCSNTCGNGSCKNECGKACGSDCTGTCTGNNTAPLTNV